MGSASKRRFLDLSALLDHLKPPEVDPLGDFFTCEKSASKLDCGFPELRLNRVVW